MWTRSEIKHPDRLKRLVALLERDASNPEGVQFDLGTWASPAGGGMTWDTAEQPKVDCGTRACAMGLAAISGEFTAEGLSHQFEPYHGGFQLCPRIVDELGRVQTHMQAATALFGIDLDAAQWLFDPSYYSSDIPTNERDGELAVAARITGFLANGRYNNEEADYQEDEDDSE